MIYLIPVLNAAFGWLTISSLFYLLFHPYEKKNLFIFDMQGFIPKNLLLWGTQLGNYVSEHLVNIPKMKESLLKGESLQQIHAVLESKVDDFLRNKLKEKIPVFSMFITEGMITKMKEVLMDELESLVPSVIDQIAAGDMSSKPSEALIRLMKAAQTAMKQNKRTIDRSIVDAIGQEGF